MTQDSLPGWLAIWSERLTPFLEFKIPVWTRTWCTDTMEDCWYTVFYIGDPDVIMLCLTCCTVCLAALQFCTPLADSLAWQTLYTVFQQLAGTGLTGGTSAEKPGETQLTWLASYLVRAPYSFSGGPEIQIHAWT